MAKESRELEVPQVLQFIYTLGDSRTGLKLGRLVIFEILALCMITVKCEMSTASFRNVQ